jgi:hypothetical protein
VPAFDQEVETLQFLEQRLATAAQLLGGVVPELVLLGDDIIVDWKWMRARSGCVLKIELPSNQAEKGRDHRTCVRNRTTKKAYSSEPRLQ